MLSIQNYLDSERICSRCKRVFKTKITLQNHLKKQKSCKEYEFIIKHCSDLILNIHIPDNYIILKHIIDNDVEFVKKIPERLFSIELCRKLLSMTYKSYDYFPEKYQMIDEIKYLKKNE